MDCWFFNQLWFLFYTTNELKKASVLLHTDAQTTKLNTKHIFGHSFNYFWPWFLFSVLFKSITYHFKIRRSQNEIFFVSYSRVCSKILFSATKSHSKVLKILQPCFSSHFQSKQAAGIIKITNIHKDWMIVFIKNVAVCIKTIENVQPSFVVLQSVTRQRCGLFFCVCVLRRSGVGALTSSPLILAQ